MTTIGSVTQTASTAAAGAPGTPDIFGGMGSDAFLKLLVAQLRYQNPMNPSDPTAMMGQIAQYAQVEALTKLQQGQSADQSLSQARLATAMVGQTVTASDGTNTSTGKVVSARFTASGPVLVLANGDEALLSSVTTVTAGSVPAADPPTSSN